MDQRLTARNGHHGGAALIHGVEAFLRRQALVQDGIRIVDLAAAGAGEVAAEQRFQHQDKRVALAAQHALLHHIGANHGHLSYGYGHLQSLLA